MYREIEELLHPRVRRACTRLFLDAHYPEALVAAFREVEVALREKTGYLKHGRQLIQHAFRFRGGPGLTLHQDLKATQAAQQYFEGAFAYYRNHAVHDGRGIEETTGVRGLIVASELLYLLEASAIRFSSLQELESLAKARGFADLASLQDLLRFLDGQIILDDCIDGLFEDLFHHGWGEDEYKFVFEAGLVQFQSGLAPSEVQENEDVEEIGSFELTPLGSDVLVGRLGEEPTCSQ